MEIKSKFWIESNGEVVLGGGKTVLLLAVDRLGSIQRAAEEFGMSYRHAWGAIKKIDAIADQWGKLARESNQMSSEQRHTRLAELAKEREQDFAKLLTPTQRKRLREISVQLRNQATNAFRDPEIVAELQLTSKQQEEISALQEPFIPPPFGPGPKKGPPGKGPFDGGPPKKGPPGVPRPSPRSPSWSRESWTS